MKPYLFCIGWLLTACATPLPNTFTAEQLQFIAYQNAKGERILPTPRHASEHRRQAWRDWLTAHRRQWDTSANQSVTDATTWCAQWQETGVVQRICKRGDTLVWFDYGVLRDIESIQAADKIWLNR